MKFDIPFEWSKKWAFIELSMSRVSFSARQPIRCCPACRGYDLERQWCELCHGNGYVADHSTQRGDGSEMGVES